MYIEEYLYTYIFLCACVSMSDLDIDNAAAAIRKYGIALATAPPQTSCNMLG